jgi:pilus assembly protein CpaC
VIAGLLRDEIVSSVAQYPGVGDIPVLGALFRSKSFQNRRTELVLIVRPRLVKPLGPEQIPLPTDRYVAPNDWEYYGLGRLEGSAAEGRDPHFWKAWGGAAEAPKRESSGGLIGEFGPRMRVPAPRTVPPTTTGEER